MRKMIFLVILLGWLGWIGCSNVQTEHVLLEGATYSGYSSNHKVTILSEPPQKRYTKIANLQATAEEPTSEEELRAGLIEEARRVGADAIIDVELEEKEWKYQMPIVGPGGGVTGGVQNKGKLAIMKGIAIKYK